jgi:hypothetical protein
VRDGKGTQVIEGSAYANSPDVGQYGPFHITIDSLPTTQSAHITIEVFDYSAKDGSQIDTVTLPLQFTP